LNVIVSIDVLVLKPITARVRMASHISSQPSIKPMQSFHYTNC